MSNTITKSYPATGEWLPVLDKGYVRVPEENGSPLVLGSDLNVANAARASFAKESLQFDDNDKRLLNFLWSRHETAPFRHSFITFEVKAPLLTARQWWKYAVGSNHGEMTTAWSETSRRYVTMEPEFYIVPPEGWRCAPENKKQGSGAPLELFEGKMLTAALMQSIEDGMARYEYALEKNVAPELARLFLPAYGMYTVWRWTASLNSVCHFLEERLAEKAQHEILVFAEAVYKLTELYFPVTMEALLS